MRATYDNSRRRGKRQSALCAVMIEGRESEAKAERRFFQAG
jgi:hypothetical protein